MRVKVFRRTPTPSLNRSGGADILKGRGQSICIAADEAVGFRWMLVERGWQSELPVQWIRGRDIREQRDNSVMLRKENSAEEEREGKNDGSVPKTKERRRELGTGVLACAQFRDVIVHEPETMAF